MDMQLKVISEFKELFPNATLKKISELTGIQITRVFRLINGREMKLSEYQSFRQVITKNESKKIEENSIF